MKKIVSAIGVSVLGLGASFFASPALASGLVDCGTAPTGGTMTESGGVCTLTFDDAGTYSFTTPAAVADFQALLVGAGGGAWVNGTNGYAGSGGKVKYVPLGSGATSKVFAIVVGLGGPSDAVSPLDGTDSTITYDSQTLLASRGYMSNGWCVVTGSGTDQTGVGNGAGGDTPSSNGEQCVTAPGVNPSAGNVDSTGLAVPALFANYNLNLGKGGSVLVSPAGLPTLTAGAGASVIMDNATTSSVANDAKAGDGLVVLRWSLEDAPDDLANTGSESSELLAVAAGAIGVGAVLVVAKRRARGRHRA